ncbi:hypothetical protein KI387_005950, partial [Taxus chinensis]
SATSLGWVLDVLMHVLNLTCSAICVAPLTRDSSLFLINISLGLNTVVLKKVWPYLNKIIRKGELKRDWITGFKLETLEHRFYAMAFRSY